MLLIPRPDLQNGAGLWQGAAPWFVPTELYPVPYLTPCPFLPTPQIMPSGITIYHSLYPIYSSLCLLTLKETWFFPEDTDPTGTLSRGDAFLPSGLVPLSLEEIQSPPFFTLTLIPLKSPGFIFLSAEAL